MKKWRPGSGWKHMGGAVWQYKNGTRIHVGGLIRKPDMTFVSLNKCPEGNEGWGQIAINGGNRKRGLMAWAVGLTAQLWGYPVGDIVKESDEKLCFRLHQLCKAVT